MSPTEPMVTEVPSGNEIPAASDPQVTVFKAWSAERGLKVPVALPTMPVAWFATKYPALPPRYGPAVLMGMPPGKKEEAQPLVKDVGEDFLAATLGEMGTSEAPTVFMSSEDRFYSYDPEAGIYVEVREAKLMAQLSEVLLACARDCSTECDTTNLEFRFRDSANLRGVLQRARGLLEVPPDFFECNLQEFIACRNGMLRLADREVLPFWPRWNLGRIRRCGK